MIRWDNPQRMHSHPHDMGLQEGRTRRGGCGCTVRNSSAQFAPVAMDAHTRPNTYSGWMYVSFVAGGTYIDYSNNGSQEWAQDLWYFDPDLVQWCWVAGVLGQFGGIINYYGLFRVPSAGALIPA